MLVISFSNIYVILIFFDNVISNFLINGIITLTFHVMYCMLNIFYFPSGNFNLILFYFQEKDIFQVNSEGKKDNEYTSDSIICPLGPSQLVAAGLVAAGLAKKEVDSKLFILF